MKFKFIWMLLIVNGLFVASCKKDDGIETSTSTQILTFKLITPAAREGIIDYGSKKVNFTSFKPYTDISAVTVEITVSPGATVSPTSGSEVNFSNGPVPFTVTNGSKSSVYMVTIVVDPPARVAFISDYTLASQITESDTKAAYDFLKKNYGSNLIYIAFKNINKYTLEYVDVIFYYQNPDTLKTYETLLPSIATNSNVVSELKTWFNEGGHFILAGHAIKYLKYLERLPDSDKISFESNQINLFITLLDSIINDVFTRKHLRFNIFE